MTKMATEITDSDQTDEPKKRRFATITDDEYNRILNEKDSENTKKATRNAVRTFRAYLQEKCVDSNFEEFSKEELEKRLKGFYTEVRQENGEAYKRTSVFSLRHGLHRHLCNIGVCVDILKDPEFRESNKAFLAVTKQLKKSGKGDVEHYPPIDSADLAKMYQYFDIEDNIMLQEKVFVDIMLYFGRRGRDNLHELKTTDFAVKTDAGGHLYIYMVKDDQPPDDQNTADGRMWMYSKPDDNMCPVKTFIKYKMHLNPKCDRLFQRPSKRETCIKRENHGAWYDPWPLGHNSIGNMLGNISTKAGLSRRYTNHSLRLTSVHILDSWEQFASRRPVKSDTSLKTNSSHIDVETKRKLSNTISMSTSGTVNASANTSGTITILPAPVLQVQPVEVFTTAPGKMVLEELRCDDEGLSVDNRVAVVTGSTSGIGLGIAHALAKAGYNMLLTGLCDQELIDQLLYVFRSQYRSRIEFLPAKLLDAEDVQTFCGKVNELFPSGVDILVNNAGTQHLCAIDEFSIEKWDEMMAIGLRAPYLLIKSFLPSMKTKGWGRVVNISSQMGIISLEKKIPYSTYKHGLIGLTKGVASESGKYGVTCNAICPGFVKAPMFTKQLEIYATALGLTYEQAEKQFAALNLPLQKLTTIQEVADLVVFLCSSSGASVTGSSLLMESGSQ